MKLNQLERALEQFTEISSQSADMVQYWTLVSVLPPEMPRTLTEILLKEAPVKNRRV
jgi:hypothetical protein